MYRINPLLESDFYKQVHWNQYPKGITKVVSYFVPRMSRLKYDKHLIMFGLQSFIKGVMGSGIAKQIRKPISPRSVSTTKTFIIKSLKSMTFAMFS